MKSKYKLVAMPIMVPRGEYCCNLSGVNEPICESFDNEYGHPKCTLGYTPQKNDGVGYPKDTNCRLLERIR